MHKMRALVAGLVLAVTACATPLLSQPGDSSPIPSWSIAASNKASSNLTALSLPGYDDSQWTKMGSRGTIMSGLLAAGVHNDSALFYSANMQPLIDSDDFRVPWIYRAEFELGNSLGQSYFVETHGISSQADLYMNGHLVAGKDVLRGAYGGKKLDVTALVRHGMNAVVVKAYPTNYLRDFALGFVDWNPYPADNGTGVWRQIDVSASGPVSMRTPQITTNYNALPKPEANVIVTVRVPLDNISPKPVSGDLVGSITGPGLHKPLSIKATFAIGANKSAVVEMKATLQNPSVWWPKAWGAQPLYTASVESLVEGKVSDKSKAKKFGIRHITSHVNKHNDTAFEINGRTFQVFGGGYGPDLFLRFDLDRLKVQFQHSLDMGLNTVRLEGKMEHPELYDLADEMGVMILPGWECCDKWEGWSYNDEANGIKWVDTDYHTAQGQVAHEAEMLQGHASVLGFLVGSDYWPNDRAAQIYVDALHGAGFDSPIVASAAKRGYPEILGPSGMKMDGPYDWVPPNYWYNDQLGAAFGFGSELGAGVGTPEMPSLQKFLSRADLDDLWQQPHKPLFHMSRYDSQFYDRTIYNDALWARYGAPTSLQDYVQKAQLADYEATKMQFESYSAMQNADRPATGSIYWMLNSAWPNLHWALFDYYLKPSGAYYGAKAGARVETAVLNYNDSSLHLVNHALDRKGPRSIEASLMGLDGRLLSTLGFTSNTEPLQSKAIGNLESQRRMVPRDSVALLRLLLKDGSGTVLSRNVYWLPAKDDLLDWNNSTWYYTPVSEYANMTALQHMAPATVVATLTHPDTRERGARSLMTLENTSAVPAFFVRLRLLDTGRGGEEVVPSYWDDNYITLWPHEKLTLGVQAPGRDGQDCIVEAAGVNVKRVTARLT